MFWKHLAPPDELQNQPGWMAQAGDLGRVTLHWQMESGLHEYYIPLALKAFVSVINKKNGFPVLASCPHPDPSWAPLGGAPASFPPFTFPEVEVLLPLGVGHEDLTLAMPTGSAGPIRFSHLGTTWDSNKIPWNLEGHKGPPRARSQITWSAKAKKEADAREGQTCCPGHGGGEDTKPAGEEGGICCSGNYSVSPLSIGLRSCGPLQMGHGPQKP
jgi:hypothetical protein